MDNFLTLLHKEVGFFILVVLTHLTTTFRIISDNMFGLNSKTRKLTHRSSILIDYLCRKTLG